MISTINLHSSFQKEKFEAAMSIVSKWDFSLTKQKLQESDYAGWTEERTEKAEENYKRYLSVTKALDGYQLVPNGDIDRFWHEHILDTRRYVQDCAELFGGFLHHYPYFGMRGETDNQFWLSVSSESTNLWKDLFGEYLYETSIVSAQKCPQKCPGSIDDSIEYLDNIDITSAQKCPQKCPGSIDDSIEYLYETGIISAQKCPQKCPGSIDDSVDRSYPYLPSALLAKSR